MKKLICLLVIGLIINGCKKKEITKPLATINESPIEEVSENNTDDSGNNFEGELTPAEYQEKFIESLLNNDNLQVLKFSDLQTDPEISPIVLNDSISVENDVLKIKLGFIATKKNVNQIAFSFVDDDNVFVIQDDSQLSKIQGEIQADIDLGLDSCEILAELCDTFQINMFAINSEGQISNSVVSRIKLDCLDCKYDYQGPYYSTAIINYTTRSSNYYGDDLIRKFVVTGQDEFVAKQLLPDGDTGFTGGYEDYEYLPINDQNTIQCYEEGGYHVVYIKGGNLIIKVILPTSALVDYSTPDTNATIWNFRNSTSQNVIYVTPPTILVYDLAREPVLPLWVLNSDDEIQSPPGQFFWAESDKDLYDQGELWSPFTANHWFQFSAFTQEFRGFLPPREQLDEVIGVPIKFYLNGLLRVDLYFHCYHQ